MKLNVMNLTQRSLKKALCICAFLGCALASSGMLSKLNDIPGNEETKKYVQLISGIGFDASTEKWIQDIIEKEPRELSWRHKVTFDALLEAYEALKTGSPIDPYWGNALSPLIQWKNGAFPLQKKQLKELMIKLREKVEAVSLDQEPAEGGL